MAVSGSMPGDPPPPRDPLVDYLKAVNDQIAQRESVGLEATPYLLQQKSELESKIGRTQKTGALESKVADPAPETAVPAEPSRPRKNDASPAGS